MPPVPAPASRIVRVAPAAASPLSPMGARPAPVYQPRGGAAPVNIPAPVINPATGDFGPSVGYPDPYAGGYPYGYDPYGGYAPQMGYGYPGYAGYPGYPGYPGYEGYSGGGLLGLFGQLLANGPLDEPLTPEEEWLIRRLYAVMKKRI